MLFNFLIQSNLIKEIVWRLFGLVALVCFAFSAVLFVIWRRDSKKVQSAHKMFVLGTIILVAGIFVYLIIVLIQWLFNLPLGFAFFVPVAELEYA